MRTFEVTLQQMQVINLLKVKPCTREEIKFNTRNAQQQMGQVLRFLVLDRKVIFENNTYRLAEGATYKTAPRIQRLLADDPEALVPKIEVYEPDELTLFEVYKLKAQGLTRSQIAKRLDIPKIHVLWTLHKMEEGSPELSNEESLFVDDVQLKVYKAIGKRWKSIGELERRLNMAYPVIYHIVEELQEMNAATIYKERGTIQFDRLDAKLICDRKRETLSDANCN